MPSVLDLPIERQRELASIEGKTLEQWVQDKNKILNISRLYSKKIREISGKKPEDWTEGDEKRARRFQTIVDSEVPGWLDEQKKLAAQNGKTLEQWLEDIRKELE